MLNHIKRKWLFLLIVLILLLLNIWVWVADEANDKINKGDELVVTTLPKDYGNSLVGL